MNKHIFSIKIYANSRGAWQMDKVSAVSHYEAVGMAIKHYPYSTIEGIHYKRSDSADFRPL